VDIETPYDGGVTVAAHRSSTAPEARMVAATPCAVSASRALSRNDPQIARLVPGGLRSTHDM